MKHKIFFVIGASGSGKTTTLKLLEKEMPPHYQLVHFDSIGVPSFEEMEKEYGSIEEWQRVKTIEWVEKLAKEDLTRSSIIFDAQVRPYFIVRACAQYGVGFEVILIDCSNEQRKKRLIDRGHLELADQNMMNWAAFLRKECQDRQYKIIDNSSLSIEQTFQQLLAWLT